MILTTCKVTKVCHDENISKRNLKLPERNKKKCKEKEKFLRRKWTDLFLWDWNNDSENTELEMEQSGSGEFKEVNQGKKTENKFGIQQAKRQILRNLLTITASAMIVTTVFLSIQVPDYGTRNPEEKKNQVENIFSMGSGYEIKPRVLGLTASPFRVKNLVKVRILITK